MVNILEIGSSSMLDQEYDTNKYNIIKIYNKHKPKYYNKIFPNIPYIDIGNTIPVDVVIYSLGVLDSDFDTTMRTNLFLPMSYFDNLKDVCNHHIFLGSVCGLPGNKYPTKPNYELSKKLLYNFTIIMKDRYPDKDIQYMALPGIKSNMTKSSSGYNNYESEDFGWNVVMEYINRVVGSK